MEKETVTKKATSRIVVDDGTIEEKIYNKRGDVIGTLIFRPTDMGIVDRWNKMAERFGEIIDPLENVDINPDGTTNEEDAAAAAAMAEAERKVREALDYAFDGNVSEAFFGGRHPFSLVGGRFYCENVMEVVGQYIAARFDAEIKKANRRMKRQAEKYTHSYRTGKHKDGKK